MKRAYIQLTEEQRAALMPVFKECFRTGGAILAQVFTDGLHVAVLPDHIGRRVAEVTGAQYEPKENSGFKAFSAGVERDKKERQEATANFPCDDMGREVMA